MFLYMLFVWDLDRCYGLEKGGYDQGYEVCCIYMSVHYFSICRMVMQMGLSLVARATV